MHHIVQLILWLEQRRIVHATILRVPLTYSHKSFVPVTIRMPEIN